MQNFTPLAGFIGGLLIGLASAIYLLAAGRMAGISGLLEDILKPKSAGFAAALAFLVGLPLGALLVAALAPGAVPKVTLAGSPLWLIGAGLLTGFGARMANGCTSGHGVCGLPRLSVRSWVATATFMAVAAATVFVVRHLLRLA